MTNANRETIDNSKLIKPCKKYLHSYLASCKEFKKTNINAVSYHDPDKFDEWKDTIFKEFDNHSKGIGLPDGYVPATTYWLVDGENYVGSGNIRHTLTDSLRKFGGHIGYMISKKYWNKGYGTLQLELLLEKAYELGIKEALLTCDVNNIASSRVMEKNEGIRIDKSTVEVDGKAREIYRYKIKTNRKI
jgi:predicted acetyltransferase